MIERNGHCFDAGGICIYCDLCENAGCYCTDGQPCDRRIVIELREATHRIIKERRGA